eukprot:9937633-Ditylum_brightwellii.AAC.1
MSQRVEAGTVPPGDGDSNNGAPVVPSEEVDSKLGASTKSDEEEKPNTTSEITGRILATMEQEDSSPHKPTSPT